MRKLLIAIIMSLCIILLFSSCSRTKPGIVSGIEPNDKVISDVKYLYRQSTLVVRATCTGANLDENDTVLHDFTIDLVISGNISPEVTQIKCYGPVLEVKSSYLLFITDNSMSDSNVNASPVPTEGDGVDVSDSPEIVYGNEEDTVRYTILDNGVHKISGESVFWNNSWVILDSIIGEMNEYNEIITVPSTTFFYSNTADLVRSSDEICIGELIDVPDLSQITTKSLTEGTVVENTVDSSIVRIRVMGIIKGSLSCNDEISMVYLPGTVGAMTDATTLSSLSLNKNVALELKSNNHYVLFLQKSPDKKQSYFFAVNPVQGWISIERDYITVARFNSPLYGYGKLSQLVSVIQIALTK